MKCMLIIGTRAEFIKVFPIIKALEEREEDIAFIHTGQHGIEDLCQTFDVKEPDIVLSEAPEDSSKFKGKVTKAIGWNLKLLSELRAAIKAASPDYVLYHGDTMSTALAALASSRFSFPLRDFETVHIEAGLRSGSVREPFPEELARIIADGLSNILFSVSDTASTHLKLHSLVGKEVEQTGNTIVDSAEQAEAIGTAFEQDGYGLVTVHRHENITSEQRLKRIINILRASPRDLVFPLHDNTKAKLEEYGLFDAVKRAEHIDIVDLVDYPDFINMIKGADILYTDGGSIQEESLIFKVPCIVLRNRTERKEGLETSLNYLSKFDVDATVEAAERMVEQDHSDVKNPYGEPGVAKRMVDFMEQRKKQ